MTGAQCDWCRKFANDFASGGWLILQQYAGNTDIFGQPSASIGGTFCTVLCLAQYAYSKAVIESEAPNGQV